MMTKFVVAYLLLALVPFVSAQCNSTTCLNGGTCWSTDSSNYTCSCTSTYTGLNCESYVYTCSQEAVNNCSSLKPALSATVSRLWSDTDYTQFCSNVDAFSSCLSNFTCPPSDIASYYVQYRQLIGWRDGVQYMCTDVAKSAYMSNQTCVLVKTKTVSDECRPKTISVNYDTSSNATKCSKQNDFYACVYLGMKYNCSEEIARMTIDFNLKQYGPPLQTAINCGLVTPYTACSTDSIKNCSAILPSDLRDNMTFPWSSADYDRFCAGVDAYSKCVNVISCVRNVDEDFSNTQTALGKAAMNKYMCTGDYRTVMMSNFNCLMTSGISSSATCYNSSFPSNLNDVTPAALCRYYTAMLSCMYDTVRKTCNDAAARVYMTSNTLFYQQTLGAHYGCQFDIAAITTRKDESPSSANKIYIQSSVTVAIAVFSGLLLYHV